MDQQNSWKPQRQYLNKAWLGEEKAGDRGAVGSLSVRPACKSHGLLAETLSRFWGDFNWGLERYLFVL